MSKYKLTVYTQLHNNYISERTFYCNTKHIANKLMGEYAIKESTVDIEMEEL